MGSLVSFYVAFAAPIFAAFVLLAVAVVLISRRRAEVRVRARERAAAYLAERTPAQLQHH
ncbi:hypothetical protein V6N00_13670 [Tersicoccus sp. MR15.9]|uniref:hypothetical protein n=1 Tax=Tersicoccus mangrovi TaxID=3121635 RepID=UPI002FE5F428